MLKDNNKSFKLLSPTGRAAKVLHDNTKEDASTIHRGLGYNPMGYVYSYYETIGQTKILKTETINWGYCKYNKLPYDIVIVDEFSMVDIWLFKRLLDAIDFNHTKLLLIGDNAQLPSVSCGNLLHDFMSTEMIPTVTLSKIFRYSSGGLMKVATDTRCCKPYLLSNMKGKANVFGDNQDYMFIDLDTDSIPYNAVALYKKLLNNGFGIEDIQVLTAKNVGDCGTVALNNMIQKIANPNYGSEVNMKIGDTTYYKGDLIMQTVNNYKAELICEDQYFDYEEEAPTAFIANGESAVIKAIYANYIIADFNGICVKYYREDMNMVKLGYAISLHKSQGGGFKIVILCTPKSHTFMLNSNLLYTGLTRMKEKLYHLGSLQTVNQAVKKKENFNRHTFMQQLLLDNGNTEC
jgi:exodeoxyribonuclease V alpha subunit